MGPDETSAGRVAVTLAIVTMGQEEGKGQEVGKREWQRTHGIEQVRRGILGDHDGRQAQAVELGGCNIVQAAVHHGVPSLPLGFGGSSRWTCPSASRKEVEDEESMAGKAGKVDLI